MKPSAPVQALRDVLLAVLHDAQGPLTTHEVIARAFENGAATPYLHYGLVYSNLRALDRLGLVTWHPWDEGLQTARWSLPENAEPRVSLEEIEAIWRLGSSR